MYFTYDELLNITQSKELNEQPKNNIKYSISTDTRTIKKGDIYLPLKGESFNGEDFIDKAIENGASGYFTTQNKKNNEIFGLLVDNTQIAYLQLAKYYKDKINPITIAITGSSGKTTTKEICATIFEANKKTHKSKLNHNNEIGLCQTLLTMPEDTEVLIVEMGMRGLGEIELLSKYTGPNHAIITNIGTAHIGRLGSRENIAKAKCEIVKYLKENGTLITLKDELYKKTLTDFNQKHNIIDEYTLISMNENNSEFIYKNSIYKLNVGGEYNILDALLAIETALVYGLTAEEIQKGLNNYNPIEKRFEKTIIGNLTIINDSYNANPDSMKAAIKTFIELYKGQKILVLADMKELGENEIKYHEEIGKYLNSFEDITIFTVGELAKNISKIAERKHKTKHFYDNIEVAKEIKNIKNEVEIFLKGSNSMNLYKIIEEIKK